MSIHFGHEIYWDGKIGQWRYSDTHEQIKTSPPRKCPKCNQYPTEDGHDPCIKNLPGVKYACCGHGIQEGYVMFEDRRVIRGNFNVED